MSGAPRRQDGWRDGGKSLGGWRVARPCHAGSSGLKRGMPWVGLMAPQVRAGVSQRGAVRAAGRARQAEMPRSPGPGRAIVADGDGPHRGARAADHRARRGMAR